MLYKVTFKTGSQQIIDMDHEDGVLLADLMSRFHEGFDGRKLFRSNCGVALVVESIAGFAPHIDQDLRHKHVT